MTFNRQSGPDFKRQACVSKRVRELARGKFCTLRLMGCDGGGDTTVHAHIRRFGWAGMNQKPHDFLGVHACANCHDMLDSRSASAPIGDDDILRALGETLSRLYAAGLLTVGR